MCTDNSGMNPRMLTTYVRPLLEFCSPVWNPINQADINIIESLRRYFTNRIPSCTFLPYKRCIEILSLDSLQKRRLIADLVCIFSIVNGSTTTFLYPYLNFEAPTITRSHNLRLTRPNLNFSSSHQNLLFRSAPIWNKLPISILSSRSKLEFRKKINSFCSHN